MSLCWANYHLPAHKELVSTSHGNGMILMSCHLQIPRLSLRFILHFLVLDPGAATNHCLSVLTPLCIFSYLAQLQFQYFLTSSSLSVFSIKVSQGHCCAASKASLVYRQIETTRPKVILAASMILLVLHRTIQNFFPHSAPKLRLHSLQTQGSSWSHAELLLGHASTYLTNLSISNLDGSASRI